MKNEQRQFANRSYGFETLNVQEFGHSERQVIVDTRDYKRSQLQKKTKGARRSADKKSIFGLEGKLEAPILQACTKKLFAAFHFGMAQNGNPLYIMNL